MQEIHQTTQKYQTFLLRVCSDVLKGEITPDGAATQLVEMRGKKREAGSVLTDVLQAVEAEVELSDDDEHKSRFKEFCRLCTQVVPGDVIQLSLDNQIEDTLNSKIIKTKTRLFYKQVKFNLLREESEGYAKIVTELSQDVGPDFNATVALQRVRCLIGQFNLDPNRVLDLILECFECRLTQHMFFVELLKLYGASKDDVCNLLGFKFTFYQAKHKCKGDVPNSLYVLAAVLIHHRLIDLIPLCTFLFPNTDWICAHHKNVMEEAVKKAKKMQFTSTATLEQKDTLDPSGSSHQTIACASAEVTGSGEITDSDERYSVGENQKLGLTWALLEIGDWPLAKQLLDRLPEFYAVRCMEIAHSLIELIDLKIDKFYRTMCPEYCCLLNNKKGSAKLTKKEKQKEKKMYICEEELKNVDSWKGLADEVFPMLHYLGPGIAHGPVVMTRLVRVLAAYVKTRSNGKNSEKESEESKNLYCKVVDVVDEVLLPALTNLPQNCAMSEELWSVIGTFPYQTRYRLYGRWKSVHSNKHPLLVVKRGQVVGRTKYVMKRLSKETTKLIGRQLGKLSHTHPTVVFDYILNQIQTFENLIGPVVESVRYLTNLEFDALSYCIIEHLASPAKEKLKVSDATLSPWLQSLATFVGTVFKKYNMELTGVLQYVANQLKAGKSFDLLVLREIVQNMSGIETTSGLTTEQVEALAGGDLLRQEGGYFAQIRNIRRTTNRLKEALLQEDLVVGLCILMAQQRGSIVYKEGEGIHLKLVGQMLDQCQDTLVQFGSFLSTNLKAEDYVKRMPSAPILIEQYHVPHDAAMFLTRPIYVNAISAKYDELKKMDRSNKISLTGEKKSQHYKAAVAHVLGPLAENLQPLFPAGIWQDISPKLFVTFWTMTMYDLHVPKASYERESERIKRSIQQAEENRELSENKRRKEKDRLAQTESKLMDEQRRQQEHVNRVMARMKLEKEDWFLMKAARSSAVNQFMQLCLLPRCVFTDLDALFCAKFINVVHSMKTTCFNTLICFDRIFNDITPLIAGLSENEASYFGRFLCAMMETMMRWHKDSAAFNKECAGFPGFFTKFRNPMNTPTNEDNTQDRVDYENFRHVVHKWHFKLTKSLLASLGSGCYVMIRNALIILIKILPYYPVLKQFHRVIESRVVKIRDDEKEKRQDLSVLAASYWGHLRVRKTPLMGEEEFHYLRTKPVVTPPTKTAAPKPAAAKSQGTDVSKGNQASEAKVTSSQAAAATAMKPPEAKKDTKVVVKTTKSIPASSAKEPAKVDGESTEKIVPPKPNKVHLHRTSISAAGSSSENSVMGSGSPKVPSGKEPVSEKKVSDKKQADSSKLLPESIKITASASGKDNPAASGGSASASATESGGRRVVRVESAEERRGGSNQNPSHLLGKTASDKKPAAGGGGGKAKVEGTGKADEKEKKPPVPPESSKKTRNAVNGEVGSRKGKEEKKTPETSKKSSTMPEPPEPKKRKVEESAKEKEEKKEKRQTEPSRSSSKEARNSRSRSRETSSKKEAGSLDKDGHHYHKSSHGAAAGGSAVPEKRKREETSAKNEVEDSSKTDSSTPSTPKKIKLKSVTPTAEPVKEKSGKVKRSRKSD